MKDIKNDPAMIWDTAYRVGHLDGKRGRFNPRRNVAAAPNIPVETESKLAAVIVALDPFERVANQIAASDDAMRRAFDAVLKIRAILDTK